MIIVDDHFALLAIAGSLPEIGKPPADRLIVLDPRSSIDEAVTVAIEGGANLLLAELVGAAVHYRAAVRSTPRNEGRTWAAVMERLRRALTRWSRCSCDNRCAQA